MASAETLIAFFLAMIVFAVFPGPAILYTAAQTITRGRRAGFMAALGLHIGGYVHVIAAALGLSAVLTLVPTAYAILKFAGALYLVWLGVNVIRQAGTTQSVPNVEMKSARRAFFESIAVEIFNPKAALFFLAFLPQFADPAAAFPVAVQLVILGVLTLMAFTAVDLLTVLMANMVVKRANGSARVRTLLGWLGGGILVALGVRLALDSRS